VKIDVEGYEQEVLEGGRQLVTKQSPAFLVEAEERHRPGAVSSIATYFEGYDYRGYFVLEGRVHPISEFHPGLQTAEELARPVPRVEMRYVNNFLFIPASLASDELIARINACLQNPSPRWQSR